MASRSSARVGAHARASERSLERLPTAGASKLRASCTRRSLAERRRRGQGGKIRREKISDGPKDAPQNVYPLTQKNRKRHRPDDKKCHRGISRHAPFVGRARPVSPRGDPSSRSQATVGFRFPGLFRGFGKKVPKSRRTRCEPGSVKGGLRWGRTAGGWRSGRPRSEKRGRRGHGLTASVLADFS